LGLLAFIGFVPWLLATSISVHKPRAESARVFGNIVPNKRNAEKVSKNLIV
jgi:hypothetical protein